MGHDAALVALAIKGLARPDVLEAALAAAPGTLSREFEALEHAALVERTKLGLRLTAAGRAAAEAVIASERERVNAEEMNALYERFCTGNDRLKAAIMAWQLRDVDGRTVPNDHTDAAYDARVIAEIAAIDAETHDVLASLAARVPRTATYRERFDGALRRVRAGERRYVAAPVIESYHTVWFELHEDLIRLSGRTRAEEAAAGRGA